MSRRPPSTVKRGSNVLPSIVLTISNGDPKSWVGLLCRVHFVPLLGLFRIVVAPQPNHRLGEFGRALRAAVRAAAETEMEIIVPKFQGVGQTQIRQRPVAVAGLQIFGAILQPNPQVPPVFAQNLIRIILTTVGDARIFSPLDAAKTTDPGNHTAELVRHLPSGIEGADASRGGAGNSTAIAVFAKIVLGVYLGEYFIA